MSKIEKGHGNIVKGQHIQKSDVQYSTECCCLITPTSINLTKNKNNYRNKTKKYLFLMKGNEGYYLFICIIPTYEKKLSNLFVLKHYIFRFMFGFDLKNQSCNPFFICEN